MSDFPIFVAAGEALTDMIVQDTAQQQWHSKVGGSTWNVARTMAALDVPTAFAGAISDDVFGDALWQASEQSQLDLRFLQRYPKSPLLAIVHRTDPPAYFFVGDDSADLHFDAAALPQGWRAHCKWMHFGGISLARQPLAGKLVALAERGLDVVGAEQARQILFRYLDHVGQFGHAAQGGVIAFVHQQPVVRIEACLLYTSPSPRDGLLSRMPSSA